MALSTTDLGCLSACLKMSREVHVLLNTTPAGHNYQHDSYAIFILKRYLISH